MWKLKNLWFENNKYFPDFLWEKPFNNSLIHSLRIKISNFERKTQKIIIDKLRVPYAAPR